jgi:hypothetical protein
VNYLVHVVDHADIDDEGKMFEYDITLEELFSYDDVYFLPSAKGCVYTFTFRTRSLTFEITDIEEANKFLYSTIRRWILEEKIDSI